MDENGNVLDFRMRDDGEAEVRDEKYAATDPDYGPGQVTVGSPVRVALYRFRDEERAKWAHMRWDDLEGGVFVRKEGTAGAWYSGHWDSGAKEYVPPWKRREVETLYREKNPEWRVEWEPEFSHVEVIRGGKVVCALGRYGFPDYAGEVIPAPTMAQARAKFRENYRLKRNEMWFQGMPVTMVFEPKSDLVVSANDQCEWHEALERHRDEWHTIGITWPSESERLEAYDRMRNFYYEEHPGKCLDRDGLRVLTFRMRGDEGHAEDVDGVAVYISGFGASATGDEAKKRAKLKAWTDAQIVKRVVFEGYPLTFESKLLPDHPDIERYTLELQSNSETKEKIGKALQEFRHCRVTIEPMGDA